MLRDVTHAMVALGACAGLACTAANPAYHLQDLDSAEGGQSGELPDAEAPDRSSAPAPDVAVPGLADAGLVVVDATSDAALPAFGISGLDSLAIDGDGTLYFDQNDTVKVWIGRRQPGALPEPHWVAVPAGLPTRGLAIDTTRRTLYLTAGMAAPVLQVIDLGAAAPAPRTVATGLVNPNDLALGAEGNVYVSEPGDGHIYSFTPAGVRTKVTKTPVGEPAANNAPAGLAFGVDGALYVGLQTTPIVRLQLANGLESGRGTYGPYAGWANGLAFDQAGHLYVSQFGTNNNAKVVRLDSVTASPVTLLTGRWFSGMVFGRGALDARWLFVAEPQGPLHRIDTDTPGLPVP